MDNVAPLERGSITLPSLVFLHAAGTGPETWMPQLEYFADTYHVLAPDLQDDVLGSSFTVSTASERIAELIAARAGGEAIVCGLSLGAFVALQLAADHPTRVRALVLSGGQAYPNRLMLAASYMLLHSVPQRFVVRPGGSKRALLDTYRTLFDWDARDCLQAVRAPTLVMCGTWDLANIAAARAMAAAIHGATLRLVPGAGHLWNGSRPKQFNDTLGSFLATLPDREHLRGISAARPTS